MPNIVTFRVSCFGEDHARAFADEIIQKGGGEGLIFRRAASHYEPGRSLSLLKLKVMSYIILCDYFYFFIYSGSCLFGYCLSLCCFLINSVLYRLLLEIKKQL